MLTVKVKNGQSETIFEAAEVSLVGRGQDHIPLYDDRILWCYPVKPGGEIRQIDAGEIFVMNADGRTVAKYRLGDEVTAGCFADPGTTASAGNIAKAA